MMEGPLKMLTPLTVNHHAVISETRSIIAKDHFVLMTGPNSSEEVLIGLTHNYVLLSQVFFC